MFTVITQTSSTHTNYEIEYDLMNGKKHKKYNGNILTEHFLQFLKYKKREYIKIMVNNYVLHKKTLVNVNAKHYTQTIDRLAALQLCLQASEIIQEENYLVNICKHILKVEKELVAIMDLTRHDGDRLTTILVFAKENNL
jgi:hypothetical protein